MKYCFFVKVKFDGFMGVFMIFEEGVNKGKMFVVLLNGLGGIEGVGWECVVFGESFYFWFVFK